MSTQKSKFELYSRLQNLGFTYEEAVSLRRIEMTLQRWGEAECGDSNDYCSTSIERDETTGKPYRVVMYHDQKPSEATRYPVADREAGALRRMNAIIAARNSREWTRSGDASFKNTLLGFHQTDCRGCMVYILRKSDIMDGHKPLPIDQYYTRSLAVCA